jgi:hypothetical protein
MFFGLNDVAFLGSLQPPVFLLDFYPNAAAAYSLRQLRTGVTNVVRVRRSSDNTEADFTATQVSDGSLAAFVGAGNNGFVRTWYDQSGNGKHAIQATTANQPQIVNTGAVLTALGKPVLSFDGINDSLTVSALIPNTSAAISQFDVVTSTNYVVTKDPGPDFWGYRSFKPSLGFRYGVVQLVAYEAISPTNPTPPFLGTGLFTRNGFIVTRVNSAQVASTATANVDLRTTEGNVSIGIGAANSFSAMNAQEIIIYLTDQSANASGIESNINAHYAIY